MENLENNLCGIYKIINTHNSKCYIGSSKDIKNRLKRHFRNLKNNKHKNKHLQASYNKYGKDKFTYEILTLCEKDNLYSVEQTYLDALDFNSNYNQAIQAGAGGYNKMQKAVILIDLKGNYVESFVSIASLLRSFNKNIRYDTASINTPKVFNRKYRIVTPTYFKNNLEEIKSWKSFTCKARERSRLFHIKRIKVYNENEELLFKTLEEVGNFIGVSKERVRQILNSTGYHKKSGYFLSKTVLTNL